MSITAAITVTARGSADDYVSYSGIASALNTHQFVYGEKDVLVDRAGQAFERVVLYTCRNGAPFARKTVSYVDRWAPNFVLEDASTGLLEGLRQEYGGRAVYFRAAAGLAERSAALPNIPGLVVDAGFDEFVRANWQRLTTGQSLTMHFLIPSRLSDMPFRIEQLRADHIDGEPVDVFRLRLGGVFGRFLTGIDVYYGVQDHLLVRYVGLSDLRDAGGNNYEVDVTFDPKDRKPSAPSAVESALQARLAPCA